MNEAQLKSYQVPPEPGANADPQTVCTLQLRGPSGKKLMRKFDKQNTLQDVVNYFKKETNDNSKLSLVIPLSKKDLSDLNKTLAEL